MENGENYSGETERFEPDLDKIQVPMDYPYLKMYHYLKKLNAWDLIQIDIGLHDLFRNYSDFDNLRREVLDHREQIHNKEFKLLKKLAIFADSNDPVLIAGETGTSKQLIAEAIHMCGDRSDKPFNEINCAAFPESIFEDMLFGHEKGAFTGANKKTNGILCNSNEGVLFLDEIAKTPGHIQAKLLKVIEGGKYYRLGNYQKPEVVDIRFIAAVHPEDLNNGKLLPDLKYRFGYPYFINLPNLRERIRLGGFLILRYCFDNVLEKIKQRNMDINEMEMDRSCLSVLENRCFPGNYRELEGILKAAIIEVHLDGRDSILPTDLDSILEPAEVTLNRNSYLDDLKKKAEDIKLSEIIKFSEEIAKEITRQIIVHKIENIYKEKKEPKQVLEQEGIKGSINSYMGKLAKHGDNFRNIIKNMD